MVGAATLLLSAGQQGPHGPPSRRHLIRLRLVLNNPLERIMKEIRRRTRVVGAFPDGQSCLNLAAARLRYIAGATLKELK